MSRCQTSIEPSLLWVSPGATLQNSSKCCSNIRLQVIEPTCSCSSSLHLLFHDAISKNSTSDARIRTRAYYGILQREGRMVKRRVPSSSLRTQRDSPFLLQLTIICQFFPLPTRIPCINLFWRLPRKAGSVGTRSL